MLVTGADGFIGSNYVNHLCQIRPDAEITVACNRFFPDVELPDADNIAFFCGDPLDPHYAEQLVSQVDCVVCCPMENPPGATYDSLYQANVVAVEQLIKSCQNAGVRRLVYLSSASIYQDFNDHLNITENYLPQRFANDSTRTRYQAECRVRDAHSEQLKTLILRPHWIIGSEQAKLFQSLLIAHSKQALYCIGDRRNIVSLTSLPNALHGIDCALFGSDDVMGDCYNIADPQPINFWQTLEQVLQQLEQPPISKKISAPVALWGNRLRRQWQRLVPGYQLVLEREEINFLSRSFTLSIEKARHKLNYHPKPATVESLTQWAQTFYSSAAQEALESPC